MVDSYDETLFKQAQERATQLQSDYGARNELLDEMAKAYTLMAYPRTPSRGTNPWDETRLGTPNVRRNQFVIAEVVSLVPTLSFGLLDCR